MLPDPIQTLLKVARVLDSISVTYLVGGSLASSYYGVPRTTNDIDVVADLRTEDIDGLVAALEPGFHVDELSIREAVASRSAFNAIDRQTFDKVDLFVAQERPWSGEQLRRRRLVDLAPGEEGGEVFVSSAEDTILAKLVWYKRGGEVSDRQWGDIAGILTVRSGRLDMAYLRKWATTLGVVQLLDRAVADASAP